MRRISCFLPIYFFGICIDPWLFKKHSVGHNLLLGIIDFDGHTIELTEPLVGSPGTVTLNIPDKTKYTISARKVDENGEDLTGASFEIYRADLKTGKGCGCCAGTKRRRGIAAV